MSFGSAQSEAQKQGVGAAAGPGTNPAYTPSRADTSVILAGMTGLRPQANPSRSTNFVSLVGGQGGLGRKPATAKRSLIGGA